MSHICKTCKNIVADGNFHVDCVSPETQGIIDRLRAENKMNGDEANFQTARAEAAEAKLAEAQQVFNGMALAAKISEKEITELKANLAALEAEREQFKSTNAGWRAHWAYKKDAEAKLAAVEKERARQAEDNARQYKTIVALQERVRILEADHRDVLEGKHGSYYQATAKVASMERVLAEAEKWIDVRNKFAKSFIDTDYAREIIRLGDDAISRLPTP